MVGPVRSKFEAPWFHFRFCFCFSLMDRKVPAPHCQPSTLGLPQGFFKAGLALAYRRCSPSVLFVPAKMQTSGGEEGRGGGSYCLPSPLPPPSPPLPDCYTVYTLYLWYSPPPFHNCRALSPPPISFYVGFSKQRDDANSGNTRILPKTVTA